MSGKNDHGPSVEVGGKTMYRDNDGFLHVKPSDAINANMNKESDYGRGSAGGCGQNPDKVPDKTSGSSKPKK